jgi:predicted nuclease of predicted toxin-antitoxin system
MTLWLDAQLPPTLAQWIEANFEIACQPVRDIGLRDASDEVIFLAARNKQAIVISKVVDLVNLVRSKGAPPKIIWFTCGNTSNKRLKDIFLQHLGTAIKLLSGIDDLVEITG